MMKPQQRKTFPCCLGKITIRALMVLWLRKAHGWTRPPLQLVRRVEVARSESVRRKFQSTGTTRQKIPLRETSIDNNSDSKTTDHEEALSPKQYTVTWLTESPQIDEEDGHNTTKYQSNTSTTNTTTTTTRTLSFPVYEGETLRTAALRRGVASPHNGKANLINCRGLGTCGTCAVEIVAGRVDPPTRNTVEQVRLSLPPHSNHNTHLLRLACQIQIQSDIQVVKRTGFWGQHEQVAEPSRPQRYFGEWEYLLDNKSPPDRQRF